jgi:hypothetical protein
MSIPTLLRSRGDAIADDPVNGHPTTPSPIKRTLIQPRRFQIKPVNTSYDALLSDGVEVVRRSKSEVNLLHPFSLLNRRPVEIFKGGE